MQFPDEHDSPASGSDGPEAPHGIAGAIRWLAEHADEQPRLADAAAAAGLSPHYFQRAFSAAVGVSPSRFLRCLKAEKAKQMLLDNRPVLDAAFEAGLSGPGRLHDLMVTFEAMTPGDYARNGASLVLRWGVARLPLGLAFMLVSERGVCGLTLLDPVSLQDALEEARARWHSSKLIRDDDAIQSMASRAFDPNRLSGPLHLLVRGTNFQVQVWRALLAIPEGCLTTYGRLARMIGHPGAARAVGGAVGSNPVSILIPCHRVIRETGALGGYACGLSWKRRLIALEASRCETAASNPAAEAVS